MEYTWVYWQSLPQTVRLLETQSVLFCTFCIQLRDAHAKETLIRSCELNRQRYCRESWQVGARESVAQAPSFVLISLCLSLIFSHWWWRKEGREGPCRAWKAKYFWAIQGPAEWEHKVSSGGEGPGCWDPLWGILVNHVLKRVEWAAPEKAMQGHMLLGEGGTYDILGLSLCYHLCLACFLLFSTWWRHPSRPS